MTKSGLVPVTLVAILVAVSRGELKSSFERPEDSAGNNWKSHGVMVAKNCVGTRGTALFFFAGGSLQSREIKPAAGAVHTYRLLGAQFNLQGGACSELSGDAHLVVDARSTGERESHWTTLHDVNLTSAPNGWHTRKLIFPKELIGTQVAVRWRFEGVGGNFMALDDIVLREVEDMSIEQSQTTEGEEVVEEHASKRQGCAAHGESERCDVIEARKRDEDSSSIRGSTAINTINTDSRAETQKSALTQGQRMADEKAAAEAKSAAAAKVAAEAKAAAEANAAREAKRAADAKASADLENRRNTEKVKRDAEKEAARKKTEEVSSKKRENDEANAKQEAVERVSKERDKAVTDAKKADEEAKAAAAQKVAEEETQEKTADAKSAADAKATDEINASLVTCADDDSDCPTWAQEGECNSNPEYMHAVCKKSCSRCEAVAGVEAPRCADADSGCVEWAATGECEANPEFMHTTCAKSCKKC